MNAPDFAREIELSVAEHGQASRHELVTLGFLYTAQFMPGTFMGTALVAILREAGVSLERLSLLYAIGLVGLLCVVFAPFVDRIRIGVLGHYRGWLILAQIGTILCLLGVATLSPAQDFWPIFSVGLMLAAFGGFSAMATDALACRLLPAESRGVGNGIQVGGGFLGNVLGGGFILAIYPVVGWAASLGFIIAFFCISIVLLLFLKERQTPARTSRFFDHARRFVQFWRAPGGGTWFLLIALYPVGIAMSQAGLKPMLIDAGWALDQIGLYVNVTGGLAAMVGAMSTGFLVRGLTRRVLLRAIPFVQCLSIFPILAIALGETGLLFVAFVNIVAMLCFSAGSTVVMTIAMDRTGEAHATTEYTVQNSAYVVFILVASALGLQVASAFGYPAAICCAALASFICGLYVRRATRPSSPFHTLE